MSFNYQTMNFSNSSLYKFIKNKKININEKDIYERFQDRLRWPKTYPWGQPSIEIINYNSKLHEELFKEDGYLNVNKCIELVKEGYTCILSNIGYFNKDTTDIQDKLNLEFGNINCNFYFGNGKKSVSFNKHRHHYPVIVKNIFGQSKWIINKKELILKNQEVIFFDKNIDHQVVDINKPKLSMTCNIK